MTTHTKTRLTARQLMTEDPRRCTPATPLNEAARLLWEGDCGVVPVVENQKVVAMLTDRDICMAAYTKDAPLSQLNVRGAMSGRLVACRPNDDLQRVQQVMREHQVRRVPIVDDQQRLLGIVSLNDVALAAADPESSLELAEVGRTLASVCERRRTKAAAA